MSGWPSTSFSFRALSPPTFVELRALYDGLYVCGGIQICRDVTYSIVVNFLECLTKQSPTNLKYVDISGYPTGEIIYIIIIYYIYSKFKGTCDVFTQYEETNAPAFSL